MLTSVIRKLAERGNYLFSVFFFVGYAPLSLGVSFIFSVMGW
jgi:hypothetical protein